MLARSGSRSGRWLSSPRNWNVLSARAQNQLVLARSGRWLSSPRNWNVLSARAQNQLVPISTFRQLAQLTQELERFVCKSTKLMSSYLNCQAAGSAHPGTGTFCLQENRISQFLSQLAQLTQELERFVCKSTKLVSSYINWRGQAAGSAHQELERFVCKSREIVSSYLNWRGKAPAQLTQELERVVCKSTKLVSSYLNWRGQAPGLAAGSAHPGTGTFCLQEQKTSQFLSQLASSGFWLNSPRNWNVLSARAQNQLVPISTGKFRLLAQLTQELERFVCKSTKLASSYLNWQGQATGSAHPGTGTFCLQENRTSQFLSQLAQLTQELERFVCKRTELASSYLNWLSSPRNWNVLSARAQNQLVPISPAMCRGDMSIKTIGTVPLLLLNGLF